MCLLYIVGDVLQALRMMHLFSMKKNLLRRIRWLIIGQMTVILHFITDGRLMFVKRAVAATL